MSRTATPPGRVRLSGELRRRQLAEAAAVAFHRLGFHQVSMADLARTAGVTAPAIYRHYTDKQSLLEAALVTGLDDVEAAAVDLETAPWPVALHRLTVVAIARRDLWILLQRELRHLDGVRRAPVTRRFQRLVRRLGTALTRAVPELDPDTVPLRVTAVLAVLASASLYRTDLPVEEYADLLTAAALAAGSTALPDTGHPLRQPAVRAGVAPVPPTRPDGSSRSEQVLRTALELFHARGYVAVSLDDIGAAVGMAGPSIYHHFDTKADLLVTAFTRATGWLAAARDGVADAPADLETLVRAYVELGVRERLLFGVYVLEAVNLPPAAGRRLAHDLGRDVAAWSAALAAARPDLTARQRLVLVQAARAVVNDVVRIGRLHARPRITDDLHALVRAVLYAPLPS